MDPRAWRLLTEDVCAWLLEQEIWLPGLEWARARPLNPFRCKARRVVRDPPAEASTLADPREVPTAEDLVGLTKRAYQVLGGDQCRSGLEGHLLTTFELLPSVQEVTERATRSAHRPHSVSDARE